MANYESGLEETTESVENQKIKNGLEILGKLFPGELDIEVEEIRLKTEKFILSDNFETEFEKMKEMFEMGERLNDDYYNKRGGKKKYIEGLANQVHEKEIERGEDSKLEDVIPWIERQLDTNRLKGDCVIYGVDIGRPRGKILAWTYYVLMLKGKDAEAEALYREFLEAKITDDSRVINNFFDRVYNKY